MPADLAAASRLRFNLKALHRVEHILSLGLRLFGHGLSQRAFTILVRSLFAYTPQICMLAYIGIRRHVTPNAIYTKKRNSANCSDKGIHRRCDPSRRSVSGQLAGRLWSSAHICYRLATPFST